MLIKSKKNKSFMKEGLGLLEVVIASAIFSIFIFGMMSVFSLSLNASNDNIKKTKAIFLLEEGVEATRILRDLSWSSNIATLTTGFDYFLIFSSNVWDTTTTNTFIDNDFERKVVLNDVYRDGNDDIASSGVIDPDIMEVVVSVSWLGRKGTTTRSVSTYMTNFLQN